MENAARSYQAAAQAAQSSAAMFVIAAQAAEATQALQNQILELQEELKAREERIEKMFHLMMGHANTATASTSSLSKNTNPAHTLPS
jgi:hypothetical protein